MKISIDEKIDRKMTLKNIERQIEKREQLS